MGDRPASMARSVLICLTIAFAFHTATEGNQDLYEQQEALFEEALADGVQKVFPQENSKTALKKKAKATSRGTHDPAVALKRQSDKIALDKGNTQLSQAKYNTRRRRRRGSYVVDSSQLKGNTQLSQAKNNTRRRRRRGSYVVVGYSHYDRRRRRRGYYDASHDSGGACFPSETVVHSKRHGKTTVDNLIVGDMVKTHHGYAEVLFFAVHKPKMAANFLKITTANSTLVLTSSHAVFKKDGTPVLAETVRVGDELLTAGTVAAVTVHRGVGLIAPVTASGALVANGVATSDYGPFAHKYGQGMAHSALVPIRLLRWMFPKWSMWHRHEVDDGHHPFKTWGSWLLGL